MKREHLQLGAVQILEEAVHLLRRVPAGVFVYYYAGTVPFLLALLFFLSDASVNVQGRTGAAELSLLVAVLFLWMSVMQSIFGAALRDVIVGQSSGRRHWGTFLRRAYLAAAIQPTKLFVIPLAALATAPLAWVFAFYQNLAALRDEHCTSLRRAVAHASRTAGWAHKQSWLVLGLISLFGVAVAANAAFALILAPHLLRTFFGIESTFTISGNYAITNTTFLAVTLAVTYAILDPVVKAVYALRCFYAESLTSGADLKAAWSNVQRIGRTTAAAILLICVCGPLIAQQAPPPAVSAGQLGDSIDQVLQRPEFQWRIAQPAKPKHGLAALADIIVSAVVRATNWVADRIRDLIDFLFPPDKPLPEGKQGKARITPLRMLAWTVIAAAFIIGVAVVWKTLRRRRLHAPTLAPQASTGPDLTDPNLTADVLPEDEWVQRAQDAAANGDLRLALRLLYLGTLAALSRRGLISIRGGKSNYDYFRELCRRARQQDELLATFERNLRTFESSWYGLHEVTVVSFSEFEANFERMRRSEI